jgi:hypothetical protein
VFELITTGFIISRFSAESFQLYQGINIKPQHTNTFLFYWVIWSQSIAEPVKLNALGETLHK